MPDNVLQFTTRVDLSGAKAGLADLASTISDQMDAAAASVESASADIAAAFETQSSAATVSSTAIADAYQAIEAQGIDTMAALNAAMAEQAAAASDAAAVTIQAATDQAAATVTSVDIQAAAYRQLAATTLELATARRQVSDAQSAYLAGELPAADAETLLAEAMERSAAATEQLALAKANLAEVTAYQNAQTSVDVEAQEADAGAKAANAEATGGLAEAEEAETGVLRSNISARMAATAEIRVLEGNIQGSTRAAGALLTMIPGVGAALQSAFAVFGAVALVEVIYQIGDALYKAFDIGGERVRKTAEDIADLTRSIEASTNSLDVQIDKLQQEDAKLEHIPFNGAKLALDEATEAAFRLEKQLEQTLKAEQAVIGKDLAPSLAQRVVLGQSGTGDQERMVQDHIKNLQAQTTVQGQLNESISYGVALQKSLADIQEKEQKSNTVVGRLEYGDITYRSKAQVAAINEMMKAQKEEQATIQATIALQDEEGKHQKIVDASNAGKDADRAAREKLQAIENQFAVLQSKSEQITGHGLTAAAALQFWTPYLNAFKEQSAEYRKVLDETVKYAQQAHKLIFEDALKTQPAAAVHLANTPEEHQQAIDAASRKAEESAREQAELAKKTEELNKLIAKQDEDLLHLGDRWDKYNSAVTQGTEIQAEEAAALAAAKDAAAEADGTITKLTAEKREAARQTELYTLRLQALQDELRRLQAASQLKAGPLGGQVNTDPANAAQIQQVQNEIAKLTGQQSVKIVQTAQKTAQDIAQPYLNAFNQINNAWLKVQNDLIAGNKNIERDFVQMGVKLVQSAAASAEQWLAKHVATYILDQAASKTSLLAKIADTLAGTTTQTTAITAAQTAQTAAVATGSASQKVIVSATNVADATSYAAVAAAAAAAAVAGIPVVGPALAPAAAAATFAAASPYIALAAFEYGGVVAGSPGSPVPIMGHAGERVLSAPQTQTFEKLVNQGGSSSKSVALHYSPTIHAFDRSGFRSTLQAHQGDILDIVKQGIKAGALR